MNSNKISKSYKFDVMSLFYEGKYYFPEDIIPNQRLDKVVDFRCNLPHQSINTLPFEVQVVYFSNGYNKYVQDTHYITEKFKNFLEKYKS